MCPPSGGVTLSYSWEKEMSSAEQLTEGSWGDTWNLFLTGSWVFLISKQFFYVPPSRTQASFTWSSAPFNDLEWPESRRHQQSYMLTHHSMAPSMQSTKNCVLWLFWCKDDYITYHYIFFGQGLFLNSDFKEMKIFSWTLKSTLVCKYCAHLAPGRLFLVQCSPTPLALTHDALLLYHSTYV